MHHTKPTGIAIPWSIGTASSMYNVQSLCARASNLSLCLTRNSTELQLKFFPLNACQQLEMNCVPLAAKRLSARLALLPPFHHSACA